MMRHTALLNALGLIPGTTEVMLTLRMPGGQTRTARIAADTTQPNIWNARPHPASWIDYPQTLVIDLRWNNGGNNALAQSLLHNLIRSDKINRRGHLFVIIGRRTFSAAQNTAAILERHTNAIFVGEPTGSSPNFVGEEDFFTLPYSKIPANVSDLFWQNTWPSDQRRWIAPLLYAPPTFEAYATNRDPAMEAIAAYRKANGQ